MNYREINQYVVAFTTNADVCWMNEEVVIAESQRGFAWFMESISSDMDPWDAVAILEQDELMKKTTTAYVNDVYVNENVLSEDEVKSRLESFGLASKDPTW